MSVELEKLELKTINAYKKTLNWGDVPAIYQLLASSVSELDGILSHGFKNNFKDLLNKKNWNLTLLGGKVDNNGQITTQIKPQISLQHCFFEHHYELHCHLVMNGEKVLENLTEDPACPFNHWSPRVSKKLFRINSLIPFIHYTFRKGDKADMQLIRFAYLRVEELINTLRESFDIIDIEDYTIAQFCRELIAKQQELNEKNTNTVDLQQSKLINDVINNQD